MSFAGLKKQINKANQFMSERVGAAEATKLDADYMEMERKTDVINELVDDLINKTREYLQPNPALFGWSPLVGVNTISKWRGSGTKMPYPQPEGLLGEAMQKHGKQLGEDSVFGKALIDAGDAYKQMADLKYGLEDVVRQNFLEPLTHLQQKDVKEVMHHRKKMQGRRLDYDCKKRKQYKDFRSYDDELRVAEEKLEESKSLAENAMYNLLDNDVEQISQLCAFVDSQVDYHKQAAQTMESLRDILKQRLEEASHRTRREHIPKPVLNLYEQGTRSSSGSKSPMPMETNGQAAISNPSSSGVFSSSSQDPWSNNTSSAQDQFNFTQPPPSYSSVTHNAAPATQSPQQQRPAAGGKQQPCCKALFDFDPENEGELGFREGQIINLISKIDDNWLEGSLQNGKAGYFPVAYVQVVVPLP